MDRLTTLLFAALLCILVSYCQSSPVMVSFGTSGRTSFPAKAPRIRPVVPKPYREPAPVWEEPEPYSARKFVVYKPKKYGFVDPKTHRVIPSLGYGYNKRYIYDNYIHLNLV